MALLEGEFRRALVTVEAVKAELAAARTEVAARAAQCAELEEAKCAADARWQSGQHEMERLIGERDLLLTKLAQTETKLSSVVSRADRLSVDLDAVRFEASGCAAQCADLKARLAEAEKLVAERDALLVRTAKAEIKAAAAYYHLGRNSSVVEAARNDIRASASRARTGPRSLPEPARQQVTRSLAADLTAPPADESPSWFGAAVPPLPEQIPKRRLSWLARRQRSRRVTIQLVRRRGKGSLMSRADHARDRRQWERAARYYRDALDQEPYNPAIVVQLGHALKESGRIVEAEGAYRYATRLTSRDHDPFLHLGHTLKLQRKITEAASTYQRALELCRDPVIAGQIRVELSALVEQRA